MLTCIINQFDCKAGTKGADFCISADKVKLANPFMNNVRGIKIAPINLLLVLNSTYKYTINKAQVKKSNDSYKLLNGKYPATIHLEQRIKNNNKLAKIEQ